MADETAMEDALALANLLRPVLLRLNRYLRYEAHDIGVTTIQTSLLAAIQRAEHIGLGELAEQEHISAPTLVNHIDKLEGAGFVERIRNCTNDRRRVELCITEAGRTILQTLRERRTAWLAQRLETLEPAQRAAIAAAIEPLQELVKKGS